MLSLEQARLLLEPGGAPSRPLDLALAPGDFVLIEAGTDGHGSALADACLGLEPAVAGEIRFQGRAWTQMPLDHAQAMRGRVGRTFAWDAWLDELGMRENILLPQLYHTRASFDALSDQAARLARRFGLPGLPLDRPKALTSADRRRAGCVRAFLGTPQLLLLESPTRGIYPEVLEALLNAIGAARDRGAAVLWFTVNAAIWEDPSLPVDRRYRLLHGALIEAWRPA